jgi:hypothetical protein
MQGPGFELQHCKEKKKDISQINKLISITDTTLVLPRKERKFK